MKHERAPFLDDRVEDIESRNAKSSLRRLGPPGHAFWVIHLALSILNLFLLIVLSSRLNFSCHVGSETLFSPANDAIQHQIEYIDVGADIGHFTGEPRPELDSAWSNLLRGGIIRISKSEMMTMNKTSIALKDGSGYIGYLEAFHMLHCVKRMYQSRYPQSYPHQVEQGQLSNEHWDHCFETLRRGIMCNADTTVNTYSWDPSNPEQILGNTVQPHKCTNWSRLQAWAESRRIVTDSAESVPVSEVLVPNGEVGSLGPPPV